MDSLLIAAASGVKSRIESLDMLANNLANAGTTAFKLDRESIRAYASPTSENDPAYGPDLLLPLIEHHQTDHAQGLLRQTGDPLDIALSGDGLLAVVAPDGSTVYTRQGKLQIAKNGALETLDHYRVKDTNGNPIILASIDPFDVDGAGTVRQAGQELGRLEIVSSDNKTQLQKLGSNYFAFQPGTKFRPSDAEVKQGYLEASNVNPAEAAVRLVDVMRQFEMLQRAIQLGAEMNRRAVEEVARPA